MQSQTMGHWCDRDGALGFCSTKVSFVAVGTSLPSEGSCWSEARTRRDAVLQVKAGKMRRKKNSDKAPHLWPVLMLIISHRLPRTDNK